MDYDWNWNKRSPLPSILDDRIQGHIKYADTNYELNLLRSTWLVMADKEKIPFAAIKSYVEKSKATHLDQINKDSFPDLFIYGDFYSTFFWITDWNNPLHTTSILSSYKELGRHPLDASLYPIELPKEIWQEPTLFEMSRNRDIRTNILTKVEFAKDFSKKFLIESEARILNPTWLGLNWPVRIPLYPQPVIIPEKKYFPQAVLIDTHPQYGDIVQEYSEYSKDYACLWVDENDSPSFWTASVQQRTVEPPESLLGKDVLDSVTATNKALRQPNSQILLNWESANHLANFAAYGSVPKYKIKTQNLTLARKTFREITEAFDTYMRDNFLDPPALSL